MKKRCRRLACSRISHLWLWDFCVGGLWCVSLLFVSNYRSASAIYPPGSGCRECSLATGPFSRVLGTTDDESDDAFLYEDSEGFKAQREIIDRLPESRLSSLQFAFDGKAPPRHQGSADAELVKRYIKARLHTLRSRRKAALLHRIAGNQDLFGSRIALIDSIQDTGRLKALIRRIRDDTIREYAQDRLTMLLEEERAAAIKEINENFATYSLGCGERDNLEIDKMKEDVTNENTAYMKPTEQSSTDFGGVSSRAVDGDIASNWAAGSCTHTSLMATGEPWWRVQLSESEEVEVSSVVITNRADCCAERLRELTISVGNSADGSDHAICRTRKPAVPAGARIPFKCHNRPLKGKYLQVKTAEFPGIPHSLTLCEVEVYGLGSPAVNYNNLALGRPTAQSSTVWGGSSDKAVDGNRCSHWQNKSCTHTSDQIITEEPSWWWVEIAGAEEQPVMVTTVVVTGRGDCCCQRLIDFTIYVGDNNKGQWNVCAFYPDFLRPCETRKFECQLGPLFGRHVKIEKNDDSALTLCEVEVYGEAPSVSGELTDLPYLQDFITAPPPN